MLWLLLLGQLRGILDKFLVKHLVTLQPHRPKTWADIFGIIKFDLLFDFLEDFLKHGPNWPLFVYFCPFLNTMTNIIQSMSINGTIKDAVLAIPSFAFIGIRTWGSSNESYLWNVTVVNLIKALQSYFTTLESYLTWKYRILRLYLCS